MPTFIDSAGNVWCTDSGTSTGSLPNPYMIDGCMGTQTASTTTTSSASTIFYYMQQQNLGVMLTQQANNYQAHSTFARPRREQTPEEIEASRIAVARREEEQAERIRKNEAVRTKARGLLIKHLSPEQQETYEKNKWFIVEGGRSKKKYQIHPGISGNVMEMREDNKSRIYRYCCHCDHSIPLEDNLLAQKLMLEAHEDEFLRLANRTAA